MSRIPRDVHFANQNKHTSHMNAVFSYWEAACGICSRDKYPSLLEQTQTGINYISQHAEFWSNCSPHSDQINNSSLTGSCSFWLFLFFFGDHKLNTVSVNPALEQGLTSCCHDFVSGFPGAFAEAGWSSDTEVNLLQVTWVSPYTRHSDFHRTKNLCRTFKTLTRNGRKTQQSS